MPRLRIRPPHLATDEIVDAKSLIEHGIRTVACLSVTMLLGCIPMWGDRSIESKVGKVFSESSKPTRWKLRQNTQLPKQYYIAEYVREVDDINNWKELLTIQHFLPSWGALSPNDAYNKLKAIRDKECPGVIKWKVISSDQKGIVYEWHASPCSGWPELHEIARIIYGENARVRIAYTVKRYEMPPETRTEWISRFTEQ